jgi:predicted RNase H-like HicB family nuclease
MGRTNTLSTIVKIDYEMRHLAMEDTFTAIFEKVDNWYIGYVQEFPGANVQGKTLEEARESLQKAIQLILISNRELAEH